MYVFGSCTWSALIPAPCKLKVRYWCYNPTLYRTRMAPEGYQTSRYRWITYQLWLLWNLKRCPNFIWVIYIRVCCIKWNTWCIQVQRRQRNFRRRQQPLSRIMTSPDRVSPESICQFDYLVDYAFLYTISISLEGCGCLPETRDP